MSNIFLGKVGQKKQLRGKNSFIAPEPFHEFEMDSFFIKDIPNQKFIVGLIMIDIFSRFMHVVPIKGKDEANIASAMIEAFHEMGGKP